MEALIEFAKILLPATLVLYAIYLTVRSFIVKEIELKKLEIRTRSIETILPARLQAYERMTLFLERMAPQNLLIRLSQPGITARDFQRLLLDEIRNEYNHNVSQQVYMSEEVWSKIRSAKEDLVMLINDAMSQLPAEATGMDLSKKVLELAMSKNVDMIGLALNEVRKEIQQTF
jgi:hypothetical protein